MIIYRLLDNRYLVAHKKREIVSLRQLQEVLKLNGISRSDMDALKEEIDYGYINYWEFGIMKSLVLSQYRKEVFINNQSWERMYQ